MFDGIGYEVAKEIQNVVKHPVTAKCDVTYNSAKDYVVDCYVSVEYKGSMVLPKKLFDDNDNSTIDSSITMLAKTIANDINNMSVESDEIMINGMRYKKLENKT